MNSIPGGPCRKQVVKYTAATAVVLLDEAAQDVCILNICAPFDVFLAKSMSYNNIRILSGYEKRPG